MQPSTKQTQRRGEILLTKNSRATLNGISATEPANTRVVQSSDLTKFIAHRTFDFKDRIELPWTGVSTVQD
jgi:hypothetical protein